MLINKYYKLSVMKKNGSLFLSMVMCFTVALLLNVSCTREGANLFQGDYSFKNSGVVTAVSVADDTDTLELSLVPEVGQMHIVCIDRESGSMKITTNAIGGDAVIYDAVANQNRIDLVTRNRHVLLKENSVMVDAANVSVSGYGERYGDVLFINMQYEGAFVYHDKDYKIIRSQIECVATHNER